MERKLLYYPDPRLREIARPVGEITQELRDVVPKMFEIMRAARGIGLAGTQVGLQRRIVVASIVYDPEKGPVEEVYVDPRIVDHSGRMREEEGCLSLPGLFATVDRHERVAAEYRTLEGETKNVEATGLHAKLFQHEIDHLDGILIIDKMSPAERKQWAPLLRELEEDFDAGGPKKQRAAGKPGL